jgi:hypothetical protein
MNEKDIQQQYYSEELHPSILLPNNARTFSLSTASIEVRASIDVPRSLPLLLADRRKLTGTSQPIARGTLLPP